MKIGQQVKILWGPYIGKAGTITEVIRIPIPPKTRVPKIFDTPGTAIKTEYRVKLNDSSILLYPPEYLEPLAE
ncbi:hypothetical protein ACFLVA_01540 [Chloroflexota bacterium]